MDRSLQLVQHIFEDNLTAEEVEALLQDEELEEEYRSMLAVKKLLDRRATYSPDDTIISAVLENAAKYTPATEQKRSFAPLRLLQTPIVRWAAAACVALVGFTAVWYFQSPQSTGDASGAQNLVDTKSAGRVYEENAAESLLRWDDSQDMMLIQERVKWLESRSEGNDWGEAPTPLEMLPGGSGSARGSDVRPAGQR